MIKEKENIRWQMLNSFGMASLPWDKSLTEYIFLKIFYDIKGKKCYPLNCDCI